jgi:photosystem II oxygen-evolving enhancer protein 2
MLALVCVFGASAGRLFQPVVGPAASTGQTVSTAQTYRQVDEFRAEAYPTVQQGPEAFVAAPVVLILGAALLRTAVLAVDGKLGRRQAVQQGIGAGSLTLLPWSAVAAEMDGPPSKMGGLLEPFIDTQKGFKLYVPAGWTKFDADPGVYDVKYQDIIEPETTVQVATSPVSTATSVEALGTLDEVAEKIASKRSARVVGKSTREVEGTLIYDLELAGEMFHERQSLCINRGKLYKVTAVTSNKKWDRRKELYKNVMLSFVPKGF